MIHLQALPDASKSLTYEGIKMNVRIFGSLPTCPPLLSHCRQLYTVSAADFSVHLKLGNYRPGFLNGSIYQHAPIFWSKLFFYDTPAENGKNWSSRFVLLNAPKNLQGDACETRIGVEPFTGQIMSDAPLLYCCVLLLKLLSQVRAQAHADKLVCFCRKGGFISF